MDLEITSITEKEINEFKELKYKLSSGIKGKVYLKVRDRHKILKEKFNNIIQTAKLLKSLISNR